MSLLTLLKDVWMLLSKATNFPPPSPALAEAKMLTGQDQEYQKRFEEEVDEISARSSTKVRHSPLPVS